ncbi:hypothetical protein CDAR_280531 [Caerostris darwini]|uniref:Uncharacterized protein n=1 Tax=Caerostris darwini TaxID=1538125 RepID=A0AAV4ME54_9ARAC|nr:hypothetical protein CDAR_280531 [Caerostris darwini]
MSPGSIHCFLQLISLVGCEGVEVGWQLELENQIGCVLANGFTTSAKSFIVVMMSIASSTSCGYKPLQKTDE